MIAAPLFCICCSTDAVCIFCSWVFPSTSFNHTVKHKLPLPFSSTATYAANSLRKPVRGWLQPRSRNLLPWLAPGACWSTAFQAHLRALWGRLCSVLWGKQNLVFLTEQELESSACDRSRIFCLCKEPARRYSPGRAPQQHVCWVLDHTPPDSSLGVTHLTYCFSSRLFAETFSILSSTEWPHASPVKVSGCLSSAD